MRRKRETTRSLQDLGRPNAWSRALRQSRLLGLCLLVSAGCGAGPPAQPASGPMPIVDYEPECYEPPDPATPSGTVSGGIQVDTEELAPGSGQVAGLKGGVSFTASQEINDYYPCTPTTSLKISGNFNVSLLGAGDGFGVSGRGSSESCHSETCSGGPKYVCGPEVGKTAAISFDAAYLKSWKWQPSIPGLGRVGSVVATVQAGGGGKYSDRQGQAECGVCPNGAETKGYNIGPSVGARLYFDMQVGPSFLHFNLGAKAVACVGGSLAVNTDCNGSPYLGKSGGYGFVAGLDLGKDVDGVTFTTEGSVYDITLPLPFGRSITFSVPTELVHLGDPETYCGVSF